MYIKEIRAISYLQRVKNNTQGWIKFINLCEISCLQLILQKGNTHLYT